ncbi:inovirus-type Gp2 protein [Burkholderia sp. 9120]|uniref:inovirus-type Gp2 protein n=1 Tax=Burkholderia sp. 9120 TaxID=1500897 RepID=UPI0012DFEE72|nr:inovirus-type Gp2 protein [Burkholderia sp. 9120]
MKYLPHHAFHPALEIIERRFRHLLRYREDILADQIQGQLHTYANEVNQAVEGIRADLLHASFRKASSEFIRASNENFRTLHAYVATLFSKCTTLWVIRLDLGYTSVQNYETVKKHRESFLRYLRQNTSIGQPFGLSWKLEFSHKGSWRHHFLLFFKPVPTTTAEQIGNQLGEHWLSTTRNAQTGRSDGAFLNCNTINRRASLSLAVRRFGTGTVTCKQLGPGRGIISAIQYMTQLDYYVKLRPKKGMKTFFGGNKKAAEEKKPAVRRTRKPRVTLRDQLSKVEEAHQAMPRYYQGEADE